MQEVFKDNIIVVYNGIEYIFQEELVHVLEHDKTLQEQHLINEVLQKSKELMRRLDKIK